MRQTHTLVRGSAGKWQLAMGQGVIMYDGPPLDPALHARYAGVYVLGDGRQLVLEWSDGALLCHVPQRRPHAGFPGIANAGGDSQSCGRRTDVHSRRERFAHARRAGPRGPGTVAGGEEVRASPVNL
jgi:hypothetical protein